MAVVCRAENILPQVSAADFSLLLKILGCDDWDTFYYPTAAVLPRITAK